MSNSSPSARSVRSITAVSFPAFSRLPKELRIMIWSEALPGPRIVFLRYQRLSYRRCRRVLSNCTTDSAGTKRFFGLDRYGSIVGHKTNRRREIADLHLPVYGFRSQAAPIPLLYVCRESWAVASDVYTRAFGSVSAFPETWFDFNRDTLYTDFDHPLEALSLDVKRVRNLAVSAYTVAYNTVFARRVMNEHFLAEALRFFGQVNTLLLVNPQHTSLDRGDLITTEVSGIGRSFLYYRGLGVDYNRAFDKRSVARAPSIEEIELENQRRFPFRVEDLEYFRFEGFTGDQPPRYELPTIERTTVTALETKTVYDSLMAEYQRKKDRYRTRLYLMCQGHEDLRIDAGEMTTMKDLVKTFCLSRDVSGSDTFAEILADDEALDPASTIYDLDLKSGTKLHVRVCEL